jgi:hypothetical protein
MGAMAEKARDGVPVLQEKKCTMTEKVTALVVFGGELNPDVGAAIAALRQVGFKKFERLHPPVPHPLDAFLEVEFDEPASWAALKAIWNQIDEIVKPHGGGAIEVYKFGQHCSPHLRLVACV